MCECANNIPQRTQSAYTYTWLKPDIKCASMLLVYLKGPSIIGRAYNKIRHFDLFRWFFLPVWRSMSWLRKLVPLRPRSPLWLSRAILSVATETGGTDQWNHFKTGAFKIPIHFLTQSCDSISCYGKPMKQTKNEIISRPISLVRSTGFPWQLTGSHDWVRK